MNSAQLWGGLCRWRENTTVKNKIGRSFHLRWARSLESFRVLTMNSLASEIILFWLGGAKAALNWIERGWGFQFDLNNKTRMSHAKIEKAVGSGVHKKVVKMMIDIRRYAEYHHFMEPLHKLNEGARRHDSEIHKVDKNGQFSFFFFAWTGKSIHSCAAVLIFQLFKPQRAQQFFFFKHSDLSLGHNFHFFKTFRFCQNHGPLHEAHTESHFARPPNWENRGN